MRRQHFWEQPEQVRRFAARDPDTRLLELLDRYDNPGSVRVLDLGCAGGRNMVVLAERGFDVYAVDRSSAMVRHTRKRVAAVLGDEGARERVAVANMADLRRFPSSRLQLVVALGVYHNAGSREEWDAALAETARVLAPGGLVLVATFTPRTDLTGRGIQSVRGSPDVYDGLPAGRAFLVEAPRLDEEMAGHGLSPVKASQTVDVATGSGRRVVVNGLFQKSDKTG